MRRYVLTVISDLHYQARRQLSYDLERYSQIKAAYNTDIPALQLIAAAETPIMKNRPKRTMLVITATIAAFLFTLLGALRKQGKKKGVAALCIGGGEATALAVELL